MREGFGPPDFIYKYSNKEKVMQPGPFNNRDSRLYNDIEKMLGELKMPKSPNNKKIKSNEEVEHVEEAVSTTLKFKKDTVAKKAGGKKVSGGYKFEFKNDNEMMKFMDKHADSIAEDTEVEEGKLVDRIMRKRKQMKNKGTIPGSDGYWNGYEKLLWLGSRS